MVDLRDEIAFGRSEGVVSGEVNVQEEDASGIGAVVRTHDGGLPMELIVLMGTSRAVSRGVLLQVSQLLLNSL